MANPLIRKLEVFAPLPEADRRLLEEVVRHPRTVEAHTDIIREGDPPGDMHFILEGFACRYKVLADGTRHIVAYMVPGDLCDHHGLILKAMDHSVATLSRCTLIAIPQQRMLELTERPSISRALWWSALVDEATLREWLVNIGGRPAEQRVAHLLCELLLRLKTVGLVTDSSYEFPITQTELGQTMGLSTVHMNRVIQSLRAEKLITLDRKKLVILDINRLNAFSGFNPNYLHMNDGREKEKSGS